MWEVIWYVWGFKVYVVGAPLNLPLVLPLIPAVAKGICSGILLEKRAHSPDTEGPRAERFFWTLVDPELSGGVSCGRFSIRTASRCDHTSMANAPVCCVLTWSSRQVKGYSLKC